MSIIIQMVIVILLMLLKDLLDQAASMLMGLVRTLVSPNDRIIICTYQVISQEELSQGFRPAIISLNEENIIQLKK